MSLLFELMNFDIWKYWKIQWKNMRLVKGLMRWKCKVDGRIIIGTRGGEDIDT
jgi:hypothetical protein